MSTRLDGVCLCYFWSGVGPSCCMHISTLPPVVCSPPSRPPHHTTPFPRKQFGDRIPQPIPVLGTPPSPDWSALDDGPLGTLAANGLLHTGGLVNQLRLNYLQCSTSGRGSCKMAAPLCKLFLRNRSPTASEGGHVRRLRVIFASHCLVRALAALLLYRTATYTPHKQHFTQHKTGNPSTNSHNLTQKWYIFHIGYDSATAALL